MRFIMIIIVALVVAMVMFGKNPVKEMQKQAIEMRKKYGSDPLTQETNMYIERKRKESGVSSLPSAPANTKVAPPDDGTPEPDDGVLIKNRPNNDLLQPATRNDGYYPPIVGSGVGAGGNAATQPSAEGGQKLRSGQPISFNGTSVYAVDKYGNKTSLPDGTYTLDDGSTIKVQAGHNVRNYSLLER